MERIGIVGVGRMGANMARRLHQVGYQITAIYDTYEPSAKALANELNTTACKTLAEVTALADVILTVVTDDKAQITLFTKNFPASPASSTGSLTGKSKTTTSPRLGSETFTKDMFVKGILKS